MSDNDWLYYALQLYLLKHLMPPVLSCYTLVSPPRTPINYSKAIENHALRASPVPDRAKSPGEE